MGLAIALLVNGLLAFPGGSDAVPEAVPFVVPAGLPSAAIALSPRGFISAAGWERGLTPMRRTGC